MIDPWLGEWLNLLARWVHLVVGAAWIGASFYFNWLNNHVRAEADQPPGVKGQLWAVHGGAFYRVQKFGGAPEKLPEVLHWFKYEAYFTWVTGLLLLIFTYWLDARTWMIDPSVADLTPAQAVGVGLATVFGGYAAYDLLCRSPLKEAPTALALVGFAGVTATSIALTELLSARAAYIHVGAMLGTIMAANVFFVIIPGQRAMVDAMVAGREPDVSKGAAGALRSLHNNYLTLPVLFIMVSNHYPVTWGHTWSWAILAAISLSAVAIRHWQNLAGRGELKPWLLPLGAVGIVATAFVTRPPPPAAAAAGAPAVPFARIQQIVGDRCLPCHASEPFFPGITAPPKDVVFDSADDIRADAARIHAQVSSRAMPLGNTTQITDEERELLLGWASGR